MLYFTILCCAILYCARLHCTILNKNMQNNAIEYNISFWLTLEGLCHLLLCLCYDVAPGIDEENRIRN